MGGFAPFVAAGIGSSVMLSRPLLFVRGPITSWRVRFSRLPVLGPSSMAFLSSPPSLGRRAARRSLLSRVIAVSLIAPCLVCVVGRVPQHLEQLAAALDALMKVMLMAWLVACASRNVMMLVIMGTRSVMAVAPMIFFPMSPKPVILVAALPLLLMYLVMPLSMPQFGFATVVSCPRWHWILASPVSLPLRLARSRAQRPQEVLPGGVLLQGRIPRLDVGDRTAGGSSCSIVVHLPLRIPPSSQLTMVIMLMERAM